MAERFMAEARAGMERRGTVGALRKKMGVKGKAKIPSAKLKSEAARLSAKAKKGKLSASELKKSRQVNLALRFRGD